MEDRLHVQYHLDGLSAALGFKATSLEQAQRNGDTTADQRLKDLHEDSQWLRDNEARIVAALNHHDALVAALGTALNLLRDEYPADQLAERGITKLEAVHTAAQEV